MLLNQLARLGSRKKIFSASLQCLWPTFHTQVPSTLSSEAWPLACRETVVATYLPGCSSASPRVLGHYQFHPRHHSHGQSDTATQPTISLKTRPTLGPDAGATYMLHPFFSDSWLFWYTPPVPSSLLHAGYPDMLSTCHFLLLAILVCSTCGS